MGWHIHFVCPRANYLKSRVPPKCIFYEKSVNSARIVPPSRHPATKGNVLNGAGGIDSLDIGPGWGRSVFSGGYSFTPSFGFSGWGGQFTNFSLGSSSSFPSLVGLSLPRIPYLRQLDPTPPPLPPPIDRRDIPSNQAVVPVAVAIQAKDWFDYWRLRELRSTDPTMGEILAPISATTPLPPEIINPPTLPAPTSPGILDTINRMIYPQEDPVIHETIGAIAGQYIQAKYGANQPRLQATGYHGGMDVGAGMRPVDTHMDPTSVLEYAGGYDPCKKQVWDPRACCGAGKWVERSRRRRKRLATRSDLADLAALQGILGSGKNLVTWIATHG